MIALNFMPQLIALNEISFSFTLISFVLHKHNSYSKAFIKAILCAVIVSLFQFNYVSFACICFTLISFVLHKHNSYSKAFIKAILCAVIVSLFQFNYVSFACIISYLLKYYGQLASIDTTSLLGILVSYLGLD
jgi:hypothetical protein